MTDICVDRRRLLKKRSNIKFEMVSIDLDPSRTVTIEKAKEITGVDAIQVISNAIQAVKHNNQICNLCYCIVLRNDLESDFTITFPNRGSFRHVYFIYEDGQRKSQVKNGKLINKFFEGDTISLRGNSTKYILYYTDKNNRHKDFGLSNGDYDKVAYYANNVIVNNAVTKSDSLVSTLNGCYIGQCFVREDSKFAIITGDNWSGGILRIPHNGIVKANVPEKTLYIPKTFTYGGIVNYDSTWSGSIGKIVYEGSIKDWMKIPFIEWERGLYSCPVGHCKEFYADSNMDILPSVAEVEEGQEVVYKSFPVITQFSTLILPRSVRKIYNNAINGVTEIYFNGERDAFFAIETSGYPNNYCLGIQAKNLYYKKDDSYVLLENAEITITTNNASSSLLSGFSGIKKITFDDGVKTYNDTMRNLADLEEVVFGDSFEGWTSGGYVYGKFVGCAKLRKVTFGASFKQTGRYDDFKGCKALKELVIKNKDIVLGDSNTSWGDVGVEIIHFNGTLQDYLSNTKLYCIQAEGCRTYFSDGTELDGDITTPQGVSKISAGAFCGNNRMGHIEISEGVTTIGKAAFRKTTMSGVYFPTTIESIGEQAFYYARFNEPIDLVLPNGLKSVGTNAFRDMSNVTSVTIPKTLTSYGDHVFHYASHPLYLLWENEEIPKYPASAFYGNFSLYIPNGQTSNYVAKGFPSNRLVEVA